MLSADFIFVILLMLVIPSHNRYRSQTIAFRVSPEEDKQINIAVSLSGMTKQDYITYKLLDRTINAKQVVKFTGLCMTG